MTDLFRVGWFRAIYGSRWFPLLPQLVLLICFALLVYGGLGVTTSDMGFAKTLRNTNLANLLVWSYWWPLIIIAAVLLGRHWCTICPMELVTSVVARFGLRRTPGKLLRSGWVVTLFYGLTLIVGIHTLAIHRVPRRMAIYMLALLGIAVLAGLIWEKRTFCSRICPVGHLLGLYSLVAMTEWRARDQQTCLDCKTRDCIDKDRYYNLTDRSCTSDLYPPRIQDNRQCLVCSQCFSACPHDNLSLRVRKPLSDLFSRIRLSSAELGFMVVVSGFVVYEILSEWSVTKQGLMAAPEALADLLGTTGVWTGTLKALVLFVGFPLVFFVILGGLRSIFSREQIGRSMSAIALAILPVMGLMHVLKSLLKMTSRIPYWPYVIDDPKGVETATALVGGTLQLDRTIPQILEPFMTGLAVLLPVLAFGLVARYILSRRGTPSVKAVSLAAVLLYAGLFEVTLIAWRLM